MDLLPAIFFIRRQVSYAPIGMLGLFPPDEIDALAVIDNGIIGTLDPPDIVYVSLTPASPTAWAFGGPATIMQVWPVVMPVYFSAQLGLLPTDDIDAITFFGPGGFPGCGPYLLGDVNGDGLRQGSDVTFLVRYFKGLSIPPYQCYDASHNTMLYSAGDVTGDCLLRGSDVTRLVAFFKGVASISACPWTPECGI